MISGKETCQFKLYLRNYVSHRKIIVSLNSGQYCLLLPDLKKIYLLKILLKFTNSDDYVSLELKKYSYEEKENNNSGIHKLYHKNEHKTGCF